MALVTSIREEHGIPPLKRYFIMFVRGHTVLFVCLRDLVSKGRHKAATPNCVSLGEDGVCFVIVSIYAVLA